MKGWWLSGLAVVLWMSFFAFTMIFFGTTDSDALIWTLIGVALVAALFATLKIAGSEKLKRVPAFQGPMLVIATVMMALGHLGPLTVVYIILSTGPGGSSGLMALLPMLWAVVFYGIGTITGFVGIGEYGRRAQGEAP